MDGLLSKLHKAKSVQSVPSLYLHHLLHKKFFRGGLAPSGEVAQVSSHLPHLSNGKGSRCSTLCFLGVSASPMGCVHEASGGFFSLCIPRPPQPVGQGIRGSEAPVGGVLQMGSLRTAQSLRPKEPPPRHGPGLSPTSLQAAVARSPIFTQIIDPQQTWVQQTEFSSLMHKGAIRGVEQGNLGRVLFQIFSGSLTGWVQIPIWKGH